MTQAQEEGHNGACKMRTKKATFAGPRHVKGLRGLEDGEAAKVSIRELEEQVLFPNESRINIVRIARQARKKLFQIFRQGENEVLVASKTRDGMNN